MPKLLTVTILLAVDGEDLSEEQRQPERVVIENSPGYYLAVMDLAGNLHVQCDGGYIAAVRAAVHEDVCTVPGARPVLAYPPSGEAPHAH